MRNLVRTDSEKVKMVTPGRADKKSRVIKMEMFSHTCCLLIPSVKDKTLENLHVYISILIIASSSFTTVLTAATLSFRLWCSHVPSLLSYTARSVCSHGLKGILNSMKNQKPVKLLVKVLRTGDFLGSGTLHHHAPRQMPTYVTCTCNSACLADLW